MPRFLNPGDNVLLTSCHVWYELPAGALGTVTYVHGNVLEVEFHNVVIPGQEGTHTITAPIWEGALQKVS